jgi:DNA polymerase-1
MFSNVGGGELAFGPRADGLRTDPAANTNNNTHVDADTVRPQYTARNGRNWAHIDIISLIRAAGCSLRQKSPDKWVGDHSPRHPSKSGECLVAWPERGRWHCTSCGLGGDAAAWIAHLEDCDYAEACRRLEERFGPAPNQSPYDALPWIDVSGQDIRRMAFETWRTICQRNDPAPTLYRFGGQLVRLERDEDGALVPVELTADRLSHVLVRWANFFRWTQDSTARREIVRPPAFLLRDLLATPEPPLPVLRRIVEVPVFAPDGALQTVPGYHPASKTYYDPPLELRVRPVPDRPADADVARARSLILDDLLIDFPFVSDADRAHAVALLLLPFVRDLIPGPTPLHLIEAPCEGSGKGLLAEVCLLPAHGRRFGAMPAGRDGDEWRKAITSVLRAGHGAVLIDNVTRPLDSGDLAAALTATTWEDRLLGKTELLRLPVRCVWVATANNPAVSREIMRRCVRIRIDPRVDEPWRRAGFKHPNLRAWADSRRGELVWAALTLVQHWLARGRPTPSVRLLGSFEAWTEVLGGILHAAGIPGFLENLDEFYREANTEVAAWRAFVTAWWEHFGAEPVLARELLPLALEVDGLDVHGKDEAAQARSLGKKLEKMRDRVIGTYRIERAGAEHRAVRWRVQVSPSASAAPARGAYGSFGEFCEFCEYFPPRSEMTVEDVCAVPGCGRLIERFGPDGRGYCERHAPPDPDPNPKPNPTPLSEPGPGESGEFSPPGAERTTADPGHAGVDRRDDDRRPSGEHSQNSQNAPPRAEVGASIVAVGPSLPPVELLDDAAAVRDALPDLLRQPELGMDTETTGLDPRTCRLRLLQLATPKRVYVIDGFHVDPRVLRPLFDDPRQGPVLVGHNLKFDLQFLWAAGLEPPHGARLFDTMLADQLVRGCLPPRGLAELAREGIGIELDKSLQAADWSGELSPAMLQYAARDAAVLLPLERHLSDRLQALDLERVAELEMRALPAVVWLERSGCPFDLVAWEALSEQAQVERDQLAAELSQMAGVDVNWDLVPQVLAALRAAGLAVADTREETLCRHADHPLVSRLLRYREASKRVGTYGRDWLRHCSPADGRVHADWHPIGAQSGRMACRNPNLQNLPRDGRYRACIRPAEGWALVKADYSQIELRIAAELAGERTMIDAFRRGDDLHQLTAALVLGKRPEAVTPDDRQLAKAINFGLLYGMGPRAFAAHARTAYGVALTEAEAAALRETFFRAYPGLRRWHRAQPDGPMTTKTIVGRKRFGVEKFTEKLNSVVQGSGADGLKLALAELWESRERERCPQARPVLTVHDEIVVEAPADAAEAAREWLVDCMTRGMQAVLREVPVAVEAQIVRDYSGTPAPALAPVGESPAELRFG